MEPVIHILLDLVLHKGKHSYATYRIQLPYIYFALGLTGVEGTSPRQSSV
jgi:hypothetical protein